MDGVVGTRRNSGRHSVYVKLKGGLGNQMFQYAMGRSLARRNSMSLMLDPRSGFVQDRVYHRTFSLADFPVKGRLSGTLGQLPFWFETIRQRVVPNWKVSGRRPWGRYACEQEVVTEVDLLNCHLESNTWVEGYWQSERFFADIREEIGAELMPPIPKSPQSLSLGREIDASESIAVGVRLYEEVPEQDRAGVVQYAFYANAAKVLSEAYAVSRPVFYVFCTKLELVEGKMDLPGRIVFVTHDNGYADQLDRLWLISRCKHHIISNSSFYWWGAWLAEISGRGGKVVAADPFPFPDTIPNRWLRCSTRG